MPNKEKSNLFLKIFVPALVAIIVALFTATDIPWYLSNNDGLPDQKESEQDKREQIFLAKKKAKYEQELKQWENWSPEPLAGGVHTEDFKGTGKILFLDMDKGRFSHFEKHPDFDLSYISLAGDREAFLVGDNIKYFDRGITNFDKIGYREIRDADYKVSDKGFAGKSLILYKGQQNTMPKVGHVFFLKTTDGNVAIVQIVKYLIPDKNSVKRDVKIKYKVFPVVKDPSRPKE